MSSDPIRSNMGAPFTAVSRWPRRLVTRPWLLAFVPINAATAGFGVVLPLLILGPLHGSWADVALAALGFNLALIVASFVWGRLSDRYRRRRAFLLLNYGGFAVLYLLLAHLPNLPLLLGVYALIGILAPAGTSASNLLILEKFSESERPRAYASFQEMSIVGSVVGLLLGYFWTLSSDTLLALLTVLAGLAAVSALAVALLVTEPQRKLTTLQVAKHPESLLSRSRALIGFRVPVPFFPVRPRLDRGAIRRFLAWGQREMRHELPLIFGAGFLFNFASNLFNISYTPYLYSVGIGSSSIFLINVSNSLGQGAVFPASGRLSEQMGPDRLVRRATYLRSLGYLAVGMLTLVAVVSWAAVGINFVLFGILGVAVALYTTASSLILFRGVQGREAGQLLGLNSALGGFAAVLGAAVAGTLSVWGSYRLVFLVAAGSLLLSLPIWTAATVAFQKRQTTDDAPRSPAPMPPPDAHGAAKIG
ncbi:MAG: MFS transporter [Thermoplasmata archaeon]